MSLLSRLLLRLRELVLAIPARVGGALARYLSEDRPGVVAAVQPEPIANLRKILIPGDVILVEGRSRFSGGIKYLTQSTWSHAACFVGAEQNASGADPPCVIEADVIRGVIELPLSAYAGLNVRICRPKGLPPDQQRALCDYLRAHLGMQYDLRNVVDLARWLIPTVPSRFRRRLISLGSGDPTRAICSTLIAQAFQSIRYPILPEILDESLETCGPGGCEIEILRIRHHSLFTPRDFDLSPYFEIIKPRISESFDKDKLRWAAP